MPNLGQQQDRGAGLGLRNGRDSEGDGLRALISPANRLLKESDGPDLSEIVGRLHEALIEHLEIDKLLALPEAEGKAQVEATVRTLLPSIAPSLFGERRDEVVRRVLDEVMGLGPIQSLLDDPTIQEVMVNGPDQVYVEKSGVIQRTLVRFRDDAHIRRIAERILSIIGRRIDETSPMVDARLKDGSRVNITLPPATPKHPSITIRKFRRDRLSFEDLVAAGSLDNHMGEFLGICTAEKLNILISGGTGTGKTTLLNVISAFIPRSERIVTIEDPIELQLQQPHVVAMEARPPDLTGRHAITQRDLVRNTLRMRPDRIIVGEVRGPEAFDMLQAMNTGHEGSLTSVHANAPRDALARIENMVLMAGFELPLRAIREQVASALHLIIHLDRFPNGVRRVTQITEVTGLEADHITLQDIFTFQARGRSDTGQILGAFRPTGIRPSFADQLAFNGHTLDPQLFLEGVLR